MVFFFISLIGQNVSKGVTFFFSFSFWPYCLVYIMYTFRSTSLGFLNLIAFTYPKKKKVSNSFIVHVVLYFIVLTLIMDGNCTM